MSRHYDGRCPPNVEFHRAVTGLPDAADHELTFFAGAQGAMWQHSSTSVIIVSKDDALENTAQVLKSCADAQSPPGHGPRCPDLVRPDRVICCSD